MKICSIKGCSAGVSARGLCNRHYLRWRSSGGKTNPRADPWTADEIDLLMAAKLTPHTARFAGPDPKESFAAVAAKLGRSFSACSSKRRMVERERGHTVGNQWTIEGLWTPDEDKIIRDHMAPPGRNAPAGTWPEVAAYLGRTTNAARVRACALRRASN